MTDIKQPEFLPALRFHRLTPLFDTVAALTVRDGAIKRTVIERAQLRDGDSVLDVGCGTGTLAAAAARAAKVHVTGVDADAAILERARRRADDEALPIRFDEANATALPYAEASFDVVLSTLFFHHLTDDDKHRAAAEIVRVTRPGGRVVIADPGRPQDPLMRVAVRTTVQVLDGVKTTALNVRGELPEVLSAAGLADVTTQQRFRTPTGTYEVLTARRP